MHPKIKNRPVGEPTGFTSIKPLLLHEVTRRTASANDASRHAAIATQPASGTANHSRHHVSRHSQS
jgi:hypothetical protein